MESTMIVLGVICCFAGFLIGGLIVHIRWSARYQRQSTLQAERIIELDRNLIIADNKVDAQKEALRVARESLLDSFKSAAADALSNNNEQFLELAKTRLDGTVKEAEGNLDERKSAIEELLKPLKLSIDKHKERSDALEKASTETFGQVSSLLGGLKGSQELLEKQTTALVTALKNPRVRGKWGEIGLRRIVEFSGMNDYCDFTEQVSQATENGTVRPDLIVHLPSKRNIIVDSKLPLDSFLGSLEASDDIIKEELLVRHARAVRGHMVQLSKKEYWAQFKDHADFVVLYIEVGSAFDAALERDRTLIEDGIRNRILFASPTNLVAMLLTIAHAWQQQAISQSAQQIADAAMTLHERLGTYVEHLAKVGTGLTSAVRSYNSAIGTWETRVVPSTRRLEQLHGKLAQQALVNIDAIDLATRELKTGDQ